MLCTSLLLCKIEDYPLRGALGFELAELVDTLSNQNISYATWALHAEAFILQKYSSLIRELIKLTSSNPGKVTLYATLEPCLMCLGAAVLHRVSRIVYSCPDPRGGVTTLIKPERLTKWHQTRWPDISGNLFWEESYQCVTRYIAAQPESFWSAILEEFEALYASCTR